MMAQTQIWKKMLTLTLFEPICELNQFIGLKYTSYGPS
jgi:hypothetical protein